MGWAARSNPKVESVGLGITKRKPERPLRPRDAIRTRPSSFKSPAVDIEAAKVYHRRHPKEMDGETCLLKRCAWHKPEDAK